MKNLNDYDTRDVRGLIRKYEAVIRFGGKCTKCGYDKNLSGLEFHHLNPETKSFGIDLRAFSSHKLEDLNEELNKCILLCANCHRELHHPELALDNIEEFKDTNKKASEIDTFSSPRVVGDVCPICGKTFKKVTGKKYCSPECRRKALGYDAYPTIEELNEQYAILKNWEKVAQHFGLSRTVVFGIRKRNS